jgi:tetratricopeptide (TPR) repeat protein
MGERSLYKVQHHTGRILGPIDLDRIRRLIRKRQLDGTEIARRYPDGNWLTINAFPEISELFLLNAQDKLSDPLDSNQTSYQPILSNPSLQETVLLPQEIEAQDDLSKTILASPENELTEHISHLEDKTTVQAVTAKVAIPQEVELEKSSFIEKVDQVNYRRRARRVAEAKTIFIETPKGLRKFLLLGPKNILKILVLSLALYWVADDFLKEDDVKVVDPLEKLIKIRPKLPNLTIKNPNPQKSNQHFLAAYKEYNLDNVYSYQKAITELNKAIQADPENVRALALLASCYLNVIDATNKDETYFTVVTKLIDLSRSKKVDTTETVVADVEFLLSTHRYQAAVNRITEYTKRDPKFDPEMFYYIALAYYQKGDSIQAAKYLTYLPDHKAFSPKIFFLRGRVAEGLKDPVAAKQSYERAIKMSPDHAASRLSLVRLAVEQGEIKEVKGEINTLIKKPGLLVPLDLARTYYFLGRLEEVQDSWKMASQAFYRAIKLDRFNHDYWLEYYTSLSKQQEIGKKAASEAKMYFFLGEGEKAFKRGEMNDALNYFLQAKNSKPNAFLAYSKLGDFFSYRKDYINARINYEGATKLAPTDPDIWSRYIEVLIQNFEWEEAQKAMDKFRRMNISQSFIDKAAGDLYVKQGRLEEAQVFYKRAMQRESIDPEVYIAYGRSLIASKQYADAPFFFALARRFDPVGTEPVLLTAQAVAFSESIDSGIRILQDELQSGSLPRAELLSGIADLLIRKGQWEKADAYVEQAKTADPDLPTPWRLQAKIYLNQEGVVKDATEKALDAYNSFIERNPSDSTGYYEKYHIFMSQARFEEAQGELDKLTSLYPKYPNLHFFRGSLFSKMANFKAAAVEFELEIKHNPQSIGAYLEHGKALLELKDYAGAVGPLTTSMSLAPKLAEPKMMAAIANHKLKNFQGAIALFQAAVLLDPGNPVLYKRMGECYRDMGDTMSARAAFKKYIQMEPDAPDRAQYLRY